jgi:hypothetical protein
MDKYIVKRYQKGDNQSLYIKEEQTTQWPKEKVHKDQQRSTKHTHKTKAKTAYSESCSPTFYNGQIYCKNLLDRNHTVDLAVVMLF